MPGKRLETTEHYSFEVRDFDRSYSFGKSVDARAVEAFDEYFHLNVRAELLSAHRLKGVCFDLCIMGDDNLENLKKYRRDMIDASVGSLHMRKNNTAAYIAVPPVKMDVLWQAFGAGGLKFLTLTVRGLGHGKYLVDRISFRDTLDPDDI